VTRVWNIKAVHEISRYWEQVRAQYAAFESGLPAPASDVYLHEMPGGQFTNLKAQARSLGLEERWSEVAQAYADANMFVRRCRQGHAIFQGGGRHGFDDGVAETHTPTGGRSQIEVAFPDSVVDMFKGNLGQPEGGWPQALSKKVLKGETAITHRPGAKLPPIDLEGTRTKLKGDLRAGEDNEDEMIDNEDLNGLPDVSEGFHRLPHPPPALWAGAHTAHPHFFLWHGTGRADHR
jgi:pyruvate carboxylase